MKYAIASLIVIATVSLAALQSNAPAGKLEITTLSTDAAARPHYGTCVSCHDPHGTGTTDNNYAGRNVMLRGNWRTETASFCAGACHLP